MTRILLATVLIALAGVGIWSIAAQPTGEYRLASFSTTLDGRTPGQIHNARLAIEKLDGVVIVARGSFSFNKTVGTWSRYEGYRKAPVSYAGQLIRAWGGGVCQTSSTLYNTALLSGMKITERHRHHFAPAYVPPGRDAAVAFSNIDLAFENPFDFPITMRARCDGKRLTIEFFGKEPIAEKYEIVQRDMQIRYPQLVQLAGKKLNGGVLHPGKPGFTVNTYRITKIDGMQKTELLSIDNYPAANRIVISGK